MDLTSAVILSVVEGLSEFLPVSSTGHLVLASEVFRIPQTEFVKSFEIFIQLGAISAVVLLYAKMLFTNKKVWSRILTAFLPTAVIGFILYGIIKEFLLGNTAVTLWALFLGGIALIILELLYREKDHQADEIEDLTLKQSFLIGLCQSLSIIPGVSRAAATVIGGLFVGAKRKTAVEFSFLLAIPTMAGAAGLDLFRSDLTFGGDEIFILAVGFLGSFVVAIGAVKLLLKFIQTHTFIPFGIYRILLALLFWIFTVS